MDPKSSCRLVPRSLRETTAQEHCSFGSSISRVSPGRCHVIGARSPGPAKTFSRAAVDAQNVADDRSPSSWGRAARRSVELVVRDASVLTSTPKNPGRARTVMSTIAFSVNNRYIFSLLYYSNSERILAAVVWRAWRRGARLPRRGGGRRNRGSPSGRASARAADSVTMARLVSRASCKVVKRRMFIQDSPSRIMAKATLRVRQLWKVDDSKGGPCRGRATTGLAEHLHMRSSVDHHVRVSTDTPP